MHWPLALACIALLLTIAAQDFWYPPLRNETISAGLTGPYHVLLDAAYVPLAGTLIVSFTGRPLMELCAVVSAIALLLVAATNTAWRFFDILTDGGHAKLHSAFTIVVFVAALALQASGDHGLWWALTAANVLLPAALYAVLQQWKTLGINASPAAEKLYVSGLCTWLILWSI